MSMVQILLEKRGSESDDDEGERGSGTKRGCTAGEGGPSASGGCRSTSTTTVREAGHAKRRDRSSGRRLRNNSERRVRRGRHGGSDRARLGTTRRAGAIAETGVAGGTAESLALAGEVACVDALVIRGWGRGVDLGIGGSSAGRAACAYAFALGVSGRVAEAFPSRR